MNNWPHQKMIRRWWFFEIRRENQLRLVVYPIIYRVLAPSQVVVWDSVHQSNYSIFIIQNMFRAIASSTPSICSQCLIHVLRIITVYHRHHCHHQQKTPRPSNPSAVTPRIQPKWVRPWYHRWIGVVNLSRTGWDELIYRMLKKGKTSQTKEP